MSDVNMVVALHLLEKFNLNPHSKTLAIPFTQHELETLQRIVFAACAAYSDAVGDLVSPEDRDEMTGISTRIGKILRQRANNREFTANQKK
jgi:hypothetical protein